MGQYMSSNGNNRTHDELVNFLVKHQFVRTDKVEKVLRGVDRKLYFTDEEKHHAYRDMAWQSQLIHLSAPSVYASVLENLELQQGNTFLNIGSGIGYFSTVAGLLLGTNGVNHGIEINQLLVDQANQKLEEFKLNAAAIDHYEFCEPVFIQGNACELSPTGFYDRVYCGAGVPPEESNFMKSLIKVGGILVMPLDGTLIKVKRTGEHTWQNYEALEVLFTNLIVPEKCSFNTIQFPAVVPLSLQELCRSNIRSLLRENLQKSFPDLICRTKIDLNTNSEENQHPNPQEQLVQLIRVQCGLNVEDRRLNVEGLVGLRSLFETFSRLDETMSDDTNSVPDNELNESLNSMDELDVSTDSNDSFCEYRKSVLLDHHEKLSDETSKRKSPEAGCSESSRTMEETENSKRMKMNLASTPSCADDSSALTFSDASDLWDTYSSTSESSLASNDSFLPATEIIEQMYAEEETFSDFFEHYQNITRNNANNGGESSNELDKFKFIRDCKENELSKLLKDKIDSLPIPVPLKHFLNYYRIY